MVISLKGGFLHQSTTALMIRAFIPGAFKAYFRSRTTNRNVFNSLSLDCMPVHYATTIRADMYIRSGDYSLEYKFGSIITTTYNIAVCLNKRFKLRVKKESRRSLINHKVCVELFMVRIFSSGLFLLI